jgi:flagellar motor switch protein FliM
MSEMLSPDKIASLVEAAKTGDLPDAGASSSNGRQRQRLRTVDFSRPTKFTTEQQRRITRAAETFCQTANTRLSAELRIQMEFEVLNVAQLTWSAAQNQLPHGSLTALIDVDPTNTRLLFALEQSFVLTCLESLLGGSTDRAPTLRRLSEIDWSLTRGLLDSILVPMSLVWQELAGVTLSVGELDPPDAAQVASVSEPTLTLLIETRIGKSSYTLALLIPWIAVEPVVGAISGRETKQLMPGAPTSPIQKAMSGVPVTLRAEVASIELPVTEILGLKPGSVVRFGTRAEDGIVVFAENVKLARAEAGAAGPRRAVQIRGGGEGSHA